MEDIKQELLSLGFRIKSCGINYWVDAFEYVENTPNVYYMMEIYEWLALKYKKSIFAIERTMRYSLEPAKEKIQQKYDYYKKIDNIAFINLTRFGNKKRGIYR